MYGDVGKAAVSFVSVITSLHTDTASLAECDKYIWNSYHPALSTSYIELKDHTVQTDLEETRQIICMYLLFLDFLHPTVPGCRWIFSNLPHLLYLLCNKQGGIFRTTSLFNRISNKMKLLYFELGFNLIFGISQSFSLERGPISSS